MPNEDIKGTIKTKTTRDTATKELTTGINVSGDAAELLRQAAESPRKIQLQRTEQPTPNPLWTAIRTGSDRIGFKAYKAFIDRVLCDHDGTDQERYKLKTRWKDDLPGEHSGYPTGQQQQQQRREWESQCVHRAQFHGVDAYQLLKVATEAFLILECGVAVKPPKVPGTGIPESGDTEIPGEEDRVGGEWKTYADAQEKLDEYLKKSLIDYFGAAKLPYLNRIVEVIFPSVTSQKKSDAEKLERPPFCYDGLLMHRWSCPCLFELIWSFWHEEGMLVQSLNTISLRFQNKRGALDHDSLAHLNLDPLRPLNNFIWGYVQDEINRLTLARRVYEYDHHYGLTLLGKAVPQLRSADSRSKFLEAFHNLLYVTSRFYREDDDTTVIADAFAVLNALKEVHLILAQGAHNQFGDLPWTARVEMLVQEWLLARPEIREFLSRPPMVPYKEDWMATVDVMKQLQGWSDVTVTHFRDLGVYGEQILLSVRYGDWIDVNDQQEARAWARYWRPEIQSYMHSYRAVTGVDLTAEVTDTRQAADRYVQPALHHARRLELQRSQRGGGQTSSAAARRNGVLTRADRSQFTTT
jgi:hypothetical protein